MRSGFLRFAKRPFLAPVATTRADCPENAHSLGVRAVTLGRMPLAPCMYTVIICIHKYGRQNFTIMWVATVRRVAGVVSDGAAAIQDLSRHMPHNLRKLSWRECVS